MPGEILGIVGESGSGKTTVALAILGYARPGLSIVGGSVAFSGEEILAYSPARLRKLRGKVVSYVPQDPSSSLNPNMRIGKQLMDVLSEHQLVRVTLTDGRAGRNDAGSRSLQRS